MRVSMSAMGSWLFIKRPSSSRPKRPLLPACLFHPRDLPRQRQLAEHDAGDLELPQRALGAAGELTAVVRPRRAAVARELGDSGVVLFLLELAPNVREPRDQRLAALL